MSRALVLRPHAKINLSLHVGPLRTDGRHDVRTVMQSIALSDTLTLTPRRGPFALTTRAAGVPSGPDNLVWRAARLLWEAMGRDGEPRDVHVKLDKQIPSEAGLGGGSADAAAALVGFNRLWSARRPLPDLVRLASRLGADVPFFLHGGTALGVGRGDEVFPLEDISRLGLVLIKPSFGVSTADAYRWVDEDRAESPAGAAPAEQSLDAGWAHGPLTVINDLQAPVARRHPGIDEMLAACRAAGARVAAMTGSGSAVYGVFPETAGRKAAARLRRPDWLVLLTRTATRREAVRGLGL